MVCAKLGAAAHRPGVRMMGRVADLAPLYRCADAVISPLRAGSGLKIKLVEALAHGKAVVATRLTAQGVEDLVAGTVILADTPRSFAAGVLYLLNNPEARLTRAAVGLQIARQNFAPATGLASALNAQLGVVSRDAGSPAEPDAGQDAAPDLARPDFVWPFVTIVVPCLNEERYIGRCLESLAAQYHAGHHEILVLDGGSTDATRAIVAEFGMRHPAVRLLHNPRRLQSAALNLAAAQANPAATIMLRADAHAHYGADFVRECVRALVETGATSVVVPMLTRALPGTILQTAIAAAQSSRLGNGGAVHRVAGASGYVEHGHHAAFNLAFFRAVGGYDAEFAQNEDAEFDIRAGQAGGKIWMCAKTPVTYYPRDRLTKLAQQYYQHGTGRARTLRKHHLRPRLRQAAPAGMLGACVAALAIAPFAPEPAAFVLLYPGACLGWGAAQAARQGRPALLLAGAALVTMHLAWAAGFLRGLMRKYAAAPATVSSTPAFAQASSMTPMTEAAHDVQTV
jgi:succinoglycan biosynthesis protein ExoA